MYKKILLIVVLIVLIGAGYVYYLSTQQPTDIYIVSPQLGAQVTVTGDQVLVPTLDTSVETTLYTPAPDATLGRRATKPGGAHTGTIQVNSGSILYDTISQKIIGGFFSFDMQSIKVVDIQDTDFEAKIMNDFFEADQYPLSRFTISRIEDSTTGSMIYGDLMIKDQTHAISFPATIDYDDMKIHVDASFAIDRLIRGLSMREGAVNNYIEYTINMDFIRNEM